MIVYVILIFFKIYWKMDNKLSEINKMFCQEKLINVLIFGIKQKKKNYLVHKI